MKFFIKKFRLKIQVHLFSNPINKHAVAVSNSFIKKKAGLRSTPPERASNTFLSPLVLEFLELFHQKSFSSPIFTFRNRVHKVFYYSHSNLNE